MAGGIILMAVLVSVIPVASAMILHGIVQATANGSRFWFNRHHMTWSILPPFAIGVAIVISIFMVFSIRLPTPYILILIGALPFLPWLVPKLKLEILRSRDSFVCGVVVTTATLLAGTAGPLLDMFYQQSKLNRFAIVATKALTQTGSHLIKIGYFGWLVWSTDEPLDDLISFGPIVILLVGSVAGTYIGTLLLQRIEERPFRKVTNWIILVLAFLVLVRGVRQALN